MTINDAEMKQNEFDSIVDALNKYSPKVPKYAEAKNSQLNNAKNFYKGREKIIKSFKEKIFRIKSDDDATEQQHSSKKPTKDDVNTFHEWVIKKETGINREWFKNYFHSRMSSALLKDLYKSNDWEKNNAIVNLIKSELKDLQEEIENMSQEETENENPDEIVEIVEEILKFNKQKQSWQELKILTPYQMLSRLPISLAELKAGNNSEKLKIEIRQFLYSLYRSKNLTKQVFLLIQ